MHCTALGIAFSEGIKYLSGNIVLVRYCVNYEYQMKHKNRRLFVYLFLSFCLIFTSGSDAKLKTRVTGTRPENQPRDQ
jgi:hypothetical protein